MISSHCSDTCHLQLHEVKPDLALQLIAWTDGGRWQPYIACPALKHTESQPLTLKHHKT